MRLSGIALLLPTFCVLVDAERAEGKVYKKGAGTLQAQDTKGVEINFINNTEQAKALQAGVIQQAGIKYHESNRKGSDEQVQVAEVREGCDKMREILTGDAGGEWPQQLINAGLATVRQQLPQTVIADMMNLMAANNNAANGIRRQAERVLVDLEHFFTDALFATSKGDQEYLAMFTKHLSYRCSKLFANSQLGCHHRLAAETPAKCWGALGKARIKWGQTNVNPDFNGWNAGAAPTLLGEDAQNLEGQSVWSVATAIRNGQWHQDMVPVQVSKKPETQNGQPVVDAGEWVALNNRGFTMHVLANVAPLRILPRKQLDGDEPTRVGAHEQLTVRQGGQGMPANNAAAAEANFGGAPNFHAGDWDVYLPAAHADLEYLKMDIW